MSELLTQERLREVVSYDPKTGAFVRLKNGAKVGYIQNEGYSVIPIDGKNYRAHRLAWLYVMGRWPKEIDHIDGARSNNRFANLREVSRSVNCQNKRMAWRGSTGLLGASPERGRFRAQISVAGKKIRIGSFKTAEEAHKAYVAAKRLLHPGGTL